MSGRQAVMDWPVMLAAVILIAALIAATWRVKEGSDVYALASPYIQKTGSCWTWLRGHNRHGRPYFRNKLVYRLTYAFFRGPIPSGLVLDHLCNNPACVNPWHVEPRTQRENLLRADCGRNLGSFLGRAGRERNALGQFTGG